MSAAGRRELLLRLLTLLADGQFHSGEALAQQLGISRTLIWRTIKGCQNLGVPLHSVRGRGYRIPGGVDLIDSRRLLSLLEQASLDRINPVEVVLETDSTNQLALDYCRQSLPGSPLFVAEMQRAGRGRRGRTWVSPFAGGLCFSLVWRGDRGAAVYEGLSLVVGLALVRALGSLGVEGLQLKWPNDLHHMGRKLAGILVEICGDLAGECQLVIGIGINVRLPDEAKAAIDQPWCDLQTVLPEPAQRTEVLAAVINQLVPMLELFERKGLTPFLEEWRGYDRFVGEEVTVTSAHQRVQGRYLGITAGGAIELEIDGCVETFHGGEVSLRSSDA